jgi:hypothetical protein
MRRTKRLMHALLPFLAASILYGQTPSDPTAVLDQVRAKIRATMKRLPKCTCIQTIERSYYALAKSAKKPLSCEQIGARSQKLQFTTRDRFRLEVAQGTEREVHSWPGASHFDLTEIDQIVDGGPFGTGFFGGYLVDIFSNDSARYEYQGEKNGGDHRVLIYNYTVARSASRYEIRTYSAWTTTAYSGAIEVKPDTLEIERVTVDTLELPIETKLCRSQNVLDYRPVEIGDGSFPLPWQSDLHLVLRNGQETSNSTLFANCREHQAQSTVQFNAPTAAPSKPEEPATKPPAQPSRRFWVDLRLNNSIDTEEAAAGIRYRLPWCMTFSRTSRTKLSSPGRRGAWASQPHRTSFRAVRVCGDRDCVREPGDRRSDVTVYRKAEHQWRCHRHFSGVGQHGAGANTQNRGGDLAGAHTAAPNPDWSAGFIRIPLRETSSNARGYCRELGNCVPSACELQVSSATSHSADWQTGETLPARQRAVAGTRRRP